MEGGWREVGVRVEGGGEGATHTNTITNSPISSPLHLQAVPRCNKQFLASG